ncbi:alpha/beta fold hydrolase [Rhodococcoides fascians]|uniref:alpha/beta fold hydrolase n=1 Tax=Rhodococcoides fascians TaxID=1828 RepID=UPI000B21DA54|nr:alpha/beta hydrolase [Rhodococcus fascians]
MEVEGDRLHVARSGVGSSVLLLHGTTSSHAHFDDLVVEIGNGFDLIRPDLPGFGRTGPRSDRDYSISRYVRTIIALMDSLEVSRFAVVGNSLGGNIAWNLALTVPDRITALVLVNATGYPEKSLPRGMRLARNPLIGTLMRRGMPRPLVARGLREAVGAQTSVTPSLIDRVHRDWNRPGNAAAFVDFCSTDQLDRSTLIPQISTPTMVLRSSSIDAQHFADDIPDAAERVHPAGGHLLPEEQPRWVAEQIVPFLHTKTEEATAP